MKKIFSIYLLGFKKILFLIKIGLFALLIYSLVIIFFSNFFKNQNSYQIKKTNEIIEEQRRKIEEKINNPELIKSQENRIDIFLYRGVMCNLFGEYCLDNNNTSKEENFNSSLFGFLTNLFVLPYQNPPASGIYWAYEGMQNAGFINKSFAQVQGIGLSSLKPVQKVWVIFRDLSYLVLTIVLIAIGFMIMLRAKLNPQTVISLENALPKIVITLVVINFSLAIAGFLIDLLYVAIAFTVSIIDGGLSPTTTSTSANKVNEFLNGFLEGSEGSLLGNLLSINFANVSSALFDIVPSTMKTLFQILITIASIYSFNILTLGKISSIPRVFGQIPAIGGAIGLIVETVLIFFITPFISKLFITIIIFLTALALFFRLVLIVLRNYIELIVFVTFSPVILLLESIPGRSVFTSWFKKIFFNIFVFYFIFLIAKVTQTLSSAIFLLEEQNTQIWQPPFLSQINYSFFPALISLGILYITPDLLNLIKQQFGVKDTGINIGLGTYLGSLGATIGGLQGGISLFGSLSQAPFIGPWLQRKAEEGKGPLGKILKKALPEPQTQRLASEIASKLAEVIKKQN
ncbi:MAG: hypothetical protein NZL96_01810 [Patescibacteria group bacterium]|nr:hypothetical protein [Patescibacteria group bacterium]